MKRTLAILATGALLAACGQQEEPGIRVEVPFKAKLSKGEAGAFTVRVRARGASLGQVRESARYPATEYCLRTYGVSDVVWSTDPATGDWAYTRYEDGDLSVAGRCEGLR